MAARALGLWAAAALSVALSACDDIAPGAQVLSHTEAEATAGKIAYETHCASCHGINLAGMGIVPDVRGVRFEQKWGGKPATDLLDHIRRMPPLDPGSLTDQSYLDILAFILQSNGVSAGDTALLPWAIASMHEGATVLEASGRSLLLDAMTPVTTAMLNDPSPNDWLSWHRTNDSMGFSPLDQINRQNVGNLEMAWRLPLAPGNNNPTPLIHDGVMFFYTFPDTVMALDASDGTVLWRYQHQPSIAASRKMGIALHGNKVIVPTSDMRMLALDAKTGTLIWDTAIASDLEVVRDFAAYDLRAAPIIAGDKVIQGVVGSLVSTGSFIFALDVETGKEVWRFNTLARPGEPGGNTWNDLPLEGRSGGSVWIPGSYDPELNLAYFGVAPTYDTQGLRDPIGKPGVTNDALYTNATLALDPDTGELIWYFQHFPNDQWDLDWAFERQIIDIPVNGVMRKAVVNIGKMAILEAVDAASGEYLFSIDLGLQNIVSAIDPVTGAKTINPNSYPRNSEPYLICPNAVGARSWPPAGYNPETMRLFVPLTEGCFKADETGNPLLLTGIKVLPQAFAGSADGKMGRLQVIDLKNQTLSWRHRQQTPLISSLLATAGGLVFSGDLDPSLKAFDEATGEVLWQTTLDDVPSSSIVSYGIGQKQYIAIVVGQSNNHIRDWKRESATYAKMEGWDVEPRPVGQGSAIWVFALK